jgi:hypothetical protein
MRDGRPHDQISFGPVDDDHPGLPPAQTTKLKNAPAHGTRLMRGSAWIGLPVPQEILDPMIFVPETSQGKRERIQRQVDACARGRGARRWKSRVRCG